MTERKTVKPFPAEVRVRAVRMLREHRHEHVSKMGCVAVDCRQGRLYGGDAA